VLGRTSKLVLAAGFAIVLALALGLVQLTRSATQAATPRGPWADDDPAGPVAEHPAPHTPPVAARELRPLPTTSRRQVAMPAARPELVPPQVSFARELKRDANGKLVPIIPLVKLRAQLYRADGPMKACIERWGQNLTGNATLSFTVAANNNKLVIDTTGVQDEDTLAGYPELLACMHQTANVFVLDGQPVPELGTPIYVRRHVRIENGVLADDWIFSFSYNP
jgi:hypothetical protein